MSSSVVAGWSVSQEAREHVERCIGARVAVLPRPSLPDPVLLKVFLCGRAQQGKSATIARLAGISSSDGAYIHAAVMAI